jgi:hypothetical protein
MYTILCRSECRKTGHNLPDLAISWSMESSKHRKHRRPKWRKLNEDLPWPRRIVAATKSASFEISVLLTAAAWRRGRVKLGPVAPGFECQRSHFADSWALGLQSFRFAGSIDLMGTSGAASGKR